MPISRKKAPHLAADSGRVAVFLDRDGVVNRRLPDDYVRTVAQLELLPGAADALVDLVRAGAGLFVVTNQRGVARGLIHPAELQLVHAHLTRTLAAAGAPLDAIYVCPHEAGTCACRKPEIGLFRQAQADHPWIRLTASHMVGDSLSDALAGQHAGARVWLVGEQAATTANEARSLGVEVRGVAPNLITLIRHSRLLDEVREAARSAG